MMFKKVLEWLRETDTAKESGPVIQRAEPDSANVKGPHIIRQDRIEELAREAEKEALAKAPGLMAEYAQEHERDVAHYHFECKRFGDFLSISVARECLFRPWGNPDHRKLVTHMSAINIVGSLHMKYKSGNLPDFDGELGYYKVRGNTAIARDQSCQISLDKCDGILRVIPAYKLSNIVRCLFEEDADRREYECIYEREVHHKTKGFPRPAQDDLIVFGKSGSVLHAPAGMGRDVYDKILREIGDYENQRLGVSNG